MDLYHVQGEYEQFLNAIKSDMDVERLLSTKFATNCLVLESAIIAYNLLMIGQKPLKHHPDQNRYVKRRRLRTVIQNLIHIACRLTTHARKRVMKLGRSNFWRYAFQRIYFRFATDSSIVTWFSASLKAIKDFPVPAG